MKNKAKILIVDDNRIIREVLRGLIRHDEALHVVGAAANGESALEMIGTLKPDLVCCDILMPGMDGIAVLRAIHAVYAGTRVILVSGESRPDIVSQALKAGASGFVVKPFNAEKVLKTIHAALNAPIPECQPEPVPDVVPEEPPVAPDANAAAAPAADTAGPTKTAPEIDAVGSPAVGEPTAAAA